MNVASDGPPELRREIASLRAQLAASQQRYEEICHRIRNELQVLSALFAAQRRQCGHPVQCDICVSRICATAALHGALDTNEHEICSLGSFVRLLAETLHSAFDSRYESIVTIDGDFEIDCARAKSVGLVVVEATVNALKYALVGLEKGRIETRVRCFRGEVELVVENNGAPFPLKALSQSTEISGKGLTLMHDIAAHLDGALEITPSPMGTALRLTFRVAPAAMLGVR